MATPNSVNPQGYVGKGFPNPSPFWETDGAGGLPPGGNQGDLLQLTTFSYIAQS